METLLKKKDEVLELEGLITQGPWFPVEYAGQIVVQKENFYVEFDDLLSMEFNPEAEANGKIISMVPDMISIIKMQEEQINNMEKTLRGIVATAYDRGIEYCKDPALSLINNLPKSGPEYADELLG